MKEHKKRGPIKVGTTRIARCNLNLLELLIDKTRPQIHNMLKKRNFKASNYSNVVSFIKEILK